MKNQKKIDRKLTIGIFVAVIIAVIAGILVYNNLPSTKLRRQLVLGNNYLAELNYEQAIAAFTEAIGIDPDNEETKELLVTTYLAWADDYITRNDLNGAQDVIMKAMNSVNDERLSAKLETIKRLLNNSAFVAGVLEPLFDYKTDDLSLSGGYGGIIPVFDMATQRCGAMDYSGELVIPYEYSGFYYPNDRGYIIGIDSQDGTDAGNEYTLFDKNGDIVYKGTDPVSASGPFYTLYKGMKTMDDGSYDLWDSRLTFEYYDYDNNLIETVETNEDMRFGYYGQIGCGFVDGKSLVMRQSDMCYYELEGTTMSVSVPYEYGVMDESGSIEWIDGDGVEENDDGLIPPDQVNSVFKSSGAVALFSGADDVMPTSPLNKGYFVTLYQEGINELILRDESGAVVSSLRLDEVTADAQGDLVCPEAENVNRYGYEFVRYGDEELVEEYNECELVGFTCDGDTVLNYGSKIAIRCRDRYALVDLMAGNGMPKTVTYDYLAINNEELWLVSDADKWGYADHDGNIVALYDDATAYSKGYAVIVENGEAYVIDEGQNRLGSIREADRVYLSGEIFVIEKDDTSYMYRVG